MSGACCAFTPLLRRLVRFLGEAHSPCPPALLVLLTYSL